MWVVLYWTDERLAGWEDEELPPVLWTPRFEWTNFVGTPDIEFLAVTLANRASDRLKLGQQIQGTMNVDIDLTCFPFDINCAAVELQAGNTHRLSDGSKSGFDQGSFTVRTVREAAAGGLEPHQRPAAEPPGY